MIREIENHGSRDLRRTLSRATFPNSRSSTSFVPLSSEKEKETTRIGKKFIRRDGEFLQVRIDSSWIAKLAKADLAQCLT